MNSKEKVEITRRNKKKQEETRNVLLVIPVVLAAVTETRVGGGNINKGLAANTFHTMMWPVRSADAKQATSALKRVAWLHHFTWVTTLLCSSRVW